MYIYTLAKSMYFYSIVCLLYFKYITHALLPLID